MWSFTVCGVIPDGDDSSPALQAAARAPGRVGALAEAEQNAFFSPREEEVALSLRINYAMEWCRPFQFRPFAIDVFGALGPAAKAGVDQFARIQSKLLHLDADNCWKGILREFSVMLHSTISKMLRCRRSQLKVMDKGHGAEE